MDVETASAIESLRVDIGALCAEMRGEFARSATKDDLKAFATRDDMAVLRDELRRHREALTESVRDDIRIVAEAVAVLSQKIDSRL